MLQHDPDLKLFLESEGLNGDIKHKEKQVQPIGENKGMFGSLGGAFSGSGKFIENDEVLLFLPLSTVYNASGTRNNNRK